MRGPEFTLILSSILTVTQVKALLETPMPGYAVVEVSWDIETTSGGHRMKFNGSVQEVDVQLLKVNPKWKSEFATANRVSNLANLEKRWEKWHDIVLCSEDVERAWKWGGANVDAIKAGLDHLYNHSPGTVTMAAGPRKCMKVSCSENSAIYYCNDNDHEITVEAFGWIAQGVSTIMSTCGYDPGPAGTISGQIFGVDNWNVIIRDDWTDGC